jgi:hypothetical protein
VPREATPDFVAEVVAVVAEESPLEPYRRAALARLIRLRFGGQRVRIGIRDVAVNRDQVETRLRQGKSVSRIATEFSVSRSTICWLLRQRPHRSQVTNSQQELQDHNETGLSMRKPLSGTQRPC